MTRREFLDAAAAGTSMNLIDRIVSYFAPKAGLARARARYAMRVYDGATTGRRASNWRARPSSANTEIAFALRPLRDRARDLVRNTPHASRAIDIIVANAIGAGVRPVCNTGSDGTDRRVMEVWEEWQSQADVEGRLSFYGLQSLAIRSMIESGEIAMRLVDSTFDDDKSKVPLHLQLLESDFIDHWRDGIYQGGTNTGLTADTKRSRLGVGLGEFDRRTGLWLMPYHPGETTTYNMRPGISTFFSRREVLHPFKPLRPGQVRGVPWFAPMLTTAREFADYMDAIMVKARVEACFSAFIIQNTEFDSLMDPTPPWSAAATPDASNPDATISTLEPGTVKELKQGQDIKFAQPTTTSQVEPVLLMCLQAMAVAVGTTYDQLTGDLRQANYSSLRAGKLEFRRQVEQFQFLTIIPQILHPVWDRFIDRAILAGVLRDRRGGYPVTWVTPTWEAINPKFDNEADEFAVRSGRMSPQEFIAGWGNDWRKVLDDWKEFADACDERGLKLDIDPRNLTRTGVAQKEGEGGTIGATTKPNGKANGHAEPASMQADGNGNPQMETEAVN